MPITVCAGEGLRGFSFPSHLSSHTLSFDSLQLSQDLQTIVARSGAGLAKDQSILHHFALVDDFFAAAVAIYAPAVPAP